MPTNNNTAKTEMTPYMATLMVEETASVVRSMI